MRSSVMRSRGAWIGAGVGMFLLFLFWLMSYWLLLFSLLGLGYFLLFKFPPASKKWFGPAFVAGTSILLLVLFFAGVLRPTKQIGSCLVGPTMRGLSVARRQAAAPQRQQSQKQKSAYEISFTNKVFQYRDKARATLYTDLIVDQLTSFLDERRSAEQVANVIELRSKLTTLRSFLRNHSETGLDDPEKRRGNEKLLEKELDQFIERAGQTTTPTDKRRLDEDFSKFVLRSPYFDLQLLLSDLQDLQHRLANADVKGQVTPRISFENDRVVFEESVTLTAARGELVQADAEPLAHEAALDGMTYELILRQPEGDSRPEDLEHVDLSPNVSIVTLLSRRIVKVDAVNSCSAGYLSGIQHLDLRWPQPREVRLGVLSKTTDFGEIRSSIELDRNAKLDSVAIPLWSYFTAKEDLDVSRKQGVDTLKHPKEALTEASLSGPEPFWVELFRNTWLLRNPLVQRFRDYLIAENAISGFVVMLLAFFISKRIFKS